MTSAGNAAGSGARIALLSRAARTEIAGIVRRIEKIETAIEPRFQEHFVAANAMFSLAAISISDNHRASPAHFFAEVIATLGLLLVIFALVRSGRSATARCSSRRWSAPTR